MNDEPHFLDALSAIPRGYWPMVADIFSRLPPVIMHRGASIHAGDPQAIAELVRQEIKAKPSEDRTAPDTILAFALLGAYHSGCVCGDFDSNVGAVFRGAIPAAEDSGVTADDRLRSLFITGYIGAVNRRHPHGVPVNADGKVVGTC